MKVFVALLAVIVAVAAVKVPARNARPVDEIVATLDKALGGQRIRSLTDDINEYVDQVIENVDASLVEDGKDPAELREVHIGFNYTLLLITYHGELDLVNGVVTGLSTLHREDDVVLTIASNRYLAEIKLALDDLELSYDYSAKFMDLGPIGTVTGKVSYLTFRIVLDVDPDTYYLRINDLDVLSAGDISLKFNSNIALLDWVVNLFTDVVITVLHDLIVSLSKDAIFVEIEKVIDSINQGLIPPPPPPTTVVY